MKIIDRIPYISRHILYSFLVGIGILILSDIIIGGQKVSLTDPEATVVLTL